MDLTSLNTGPKLSLGRRKTGGGLTTQKGKEKATKASKEDGEDDDADNDDVADGNDVAEEVNMTLNEEIPTITSNRNGSTPQKDIQILDLHTYNPFVSYSGDIYSCTWADMIGTNMFFTKHEDDPETEPLRSHDDYDLLETSRIRLVGHKAKVSAKKKNRGRQPTEATFSGTATGLGGLASTNPSINAEIKRQNHFLANFMEAKRMRGDTDVFNPSQRRHQITVPANVGAHSSQAPATTREEEIEMLNRQILRGDVSAMARLHELEAERGDNADTDMLDDPENC